MQVQQTIGSRELKETMKSVLSRLAEIEQMPSDTIEQIKQKEKIYEIIMKILQRFKEVADVYVSIYFGNDVPSDEYSEMLQSISSSDDEWDEVKQRYWFKSAIDIAEKKKFFHWELVFPEVFFEEGKVKENPGFDAVVGNPPYVNANELNKILSEFEKPFWREQFQSASGAYDLYILFLEQSINLVRCGHYSSLITPNKFLSAPYAKAFREHIYNRAQIVRLLNLSRVRVFEDSSIYPVISIIRNQVPTDVYSVVTEAPRDTENPMDIVTYKHDSSSLILLPDMIWGFLISDQLPLILKAEKVSIQLQQCSTVRGSSTAREADTYENALSETYIDDGKKFINTGLIDRYATLWGVEPLTHKGVTFMTPYLRLTHSVVSSERKTQYEKKKIIFAKMALRIEAFLDENAEYASANTNFVYDPDYDLNYLTALLNSRFMTALYSIYFGTLIMSGGYFQFQAPQLRVLPIRLIHFTTPPEERTALLESLKSKYNANESDKILKIVEGCLPKDEDGNFITEEEKSDVIHDLLAFLAERMIEMNKKKNGETKGFLEWLEREIETEIDKLTNRTKLKAYYELEFDELLEILKKNKKKISITLSNREFQDNLKKEFEKSKGVLSPLRNKIEATDKLIDQIVYRLYGLTDEEIKIVESSLSTDSNENSNEESENE